MLPDLSAGVAEGHREVAELDVERLGALRSVNAEHDVVVDAYVDCVGEASVQLLELVGEFELVGVLDVGGDLSGPVSVVPDHAGP